ncbi:hypothetical protein [Thiomicrospira microaerophila]|uniref:hypothetical protein n=1 Tax=Thiomicrospira microaerophila TaxID=406020 RepID=UPI0005C89083|nr:hypothetical protein [Thiomicrospira microaerophila]
MLTNFSAESGLKTNQLAPISQASLARFGWVVGQQVSLNVIQVSSSTIKLDVGGQTLVASSALALTPGQTLMARVAQVEGQIRLVVSEPVAKESVLEKAFFRQLLPNALSLNNVMSQLTSPPLFAHLPPAAQAQINAILHQILRLDSQLNASKLKHAIEHSGSFFESGLKGMRKGVDKDLKAELHKLRALLTANPSEKAKTPPSIAQALSLVGQAIDKVSLGQLLQLQNPADLSVQLPVYVANEYEELDVEISSEKSKKKRWQLKFSVAIHDERCACVLGYDQQTGYFDCKLFMESVAGVKLIEQHLTILKDMFERAGLVLAYLDVKQGKLAAYEPALIDQLINVKA